MTRAIGSGGNGVLRRRVGRRQLLGAATAAGVGGSALALIGCGGEKEQGEAAPAAAQSEGPPSGADEEVTLTVALAAFPLGVDKDISVSIGSLEALSQCYDTPIIFKPIDYPYAEPPEGQGVGYLDLGVHEPWQIELPELAPDGASAILRVRPGIVSAQGNELTAEDIKWTIDRAYAIPSVGYFYNTLIGLDESNPIEIIDKYTAKANAKAPNGLLATIWDDLFMGFIDSKEAKAHATSDDPWAAEYLPTHSAGFGAYTLESWDPGHEAVWVTNPNYFKGVPQIDRSIVRLIPDSSVRLAALQEGAVDIAEDLTPDQWRKAIRTPGVTGIAVRANWILFLYLNSLHAPFDDLRVRQAFNMVMPRDEIAESVYLDLALPWRAAIATNGPGANPDLWPFGTKPDFEQAKALLNSAGHGDGLDIEISYSTAYPPNEPTAILIRANLAQIGVQAALNPLPDGDMVTGTYDRTIPCGVWLDTPIGPDPIYGVFLYGYDRATVSNHGQLDDPELKQMIDEGSTLLTLAERVEASQAMQARFLELSGIAPLVEPYYFVAMRDNIEGFRWHNANDIYFRQLRKT